MFSNSFNHCWIFLISLPLVIVGVVSSGKAPMAEGKHQPKQATTRLSPDSTDDTPVNGGEIKLPARVRQEKYETPSAYTNHSEHQLSCDFGGRYIKVAVAPQPPFVDCLQDFYGDWFCNGSNIEVIHVLERQLNFRAEWIVLTAGHFNEVDKVKLKQMPPAGLLGNLNESLMTPGIFGLVSTGRASISANGVMKTLDRNGYNLIVSEPFDSFRLHFLLSKSVRDHDHIFIKPFELRAWIAIFASAAMIVPIFYFINTTSAYYNIRDDRVLAKISTWQCFRHWFVSRCKFILIRDRNNTTCLPQLPCCLRRRRRSSSSTTDSSLDKEISQMMEPGFDMSKLRSIPPRGEMRRKRRLVKRQWSLERKKAKKVGMSMRQLGFFKVAYIIWYVVASLSNQGGETEDLPHATSTRILVAFWWLYLIVICAIHSGILTAILTFPKQIDFIRTLDDYLNLDLSERTEIKLAVNKFSELAHLLSDFDNLHKSPLQMLQKEKVPLLFVDFDRHRQRILDDIQQGHCALIEERSIVNQIITQEYLDSKQSKCLFKASRFPVDVIPMSIILSKQMPTKCVELINSILKRIMLTGLAQKWRRKYESPGNDCLNSVIINAGDVDKIELKHVILAFWLLVVSFVIGLLFLVGEIVWLFMVEGEEEEGLADSNSPYGSSSGSSSDSDSTSSSPSSTTSSELSHVQLGHRRAQVGWSRGDQPIRSLQVARIKTLLHRIKRHQQRSTKGTRLSRPTIGQQTLPTIVLNNSNDDITLNSQVFNFDLADLSGQISKIKAIRIEERKRRRLARAAERRSRRLNRTVDFLKRIHRGKIYSDKMKNRVGRASHAIVNRITNTQAPDDDSLRHRKSANARVVPFV